MSVPFEQFLRTVEFPYCYYAYILGGGQSTIDYLHYGLWEEDTHDLREAQENLAGLMKSLIPPGTRRILDVGCGLGRTTYDLTLLGYDTVGISPDKGLMQMARQRYKDSNVKLVLSSFENYSDDRPFDLILFQESTQYIRLDKVFSLSRRWLADNGHILMCDEIKYTADRRCLFHQKREIERRARRGGFKLSYHVDITDRVIKTRDVALQDFVNNKEPIVELFSSFREHAAEEVRSLIQGWKEHSRMFREGLLGYEVFLFRKEGAGSLTTRMKNLLRRGQRG